ncbi:MAG: RagB/SusD family nutrient uptake outer membrane protein [Phocaeicola sp.]
MMKKYLYICLASLSSFGLTSCELDFNPLDAIANTTNWQVPADAERSVNNAYRYLGNTDIQAFISCATDDSYSWSNWPSDIQYAGNGSATASNGFISNHWAHYYRMIAACNDVTDNIDKITSLDRDKLERYRAEVRVLRAYAYQQLIGLYGDVPLLTSTPKIDGFQPSRTPKKEVVDFLIADLKEITQNKFLPNSYDASNWGRVTNGAALALLARIALYDERWAEAADAASEVMKLGVYEIDENYLTLFDGTNKQSKEIILSAQYLKNIYSHPWATWLGGPSLGGWGQVVPLQGLIDSYECIDGKSIESSPLYNPASPFENRDPRLQLSIVVPGTEVNGIAIDITKENSIDKLGASNASFSGYYYKKYIPNDIEGNWDGNSYNDVLLIRYAEVLLVYAEAKIESNAIDASVLDAINEVRGRKGVEMPKVLVTSQAELREIVRRERRVEFPIEDHRLFDIRRWKIASTVMNGPAYGILNSFNPDRDDFGKNVLVESRSFNPARDYLWSIPLNEISLNANLLPNNPGW